MVLSDPRPVSGVGTLYPGSRIYKRVTVRALVSSAAVQLTPVLLSYLPNFRPGAIVICLSYDTPYHHVPQSDSHLPRHRRSLRQRLERSGRP